MQHDSFKFQSKYEKLAIALHVQLPQMRNTWSLHVIHLHKTAKKFTRIQKALVQPFFYSFNLLSAHAPGLVAVAVAVAVMFAKTPHYRSFSDLFIVLFTVVDFLLPLIVQNVGSFDVAAIFRLLRMFRAIRALRALRVLRTIR